MCTNNSCFGGNIWWIIILVLLFGCGGTGIGNDCGGTPAIPAAAPPAAAAATKQTLSPTERWG